MNESDQFGPDLRRERERRGISLQQIADQTKISAWFFAALERNDVSRWPSGIYRRAFLRAYAGAIGLDADQVVCQFLRLFPCAADGQSAAAARVPKTVGNHGRLAAAAPEAAGQRRGNPSRSTAKRRLQSTVVDVSVALGAGALAGALIGRAAIWPAVAIASVLIFLVGDLLLQTTIGTWLLSQKEPGRTSRRAAVEGDAPASLAREPHQTPRRHSIAEPQPTPRRHSGRRVERSRPRL